MKPRGRNNGDSAHEGYLNNATEQYSRIYQYIAQEIVG